MIIVEKKITALRHNVPSLLDDGNSRFTSIAREFVYDFYQKFLHFDNNLQSNKHKSKSLLAGNDDYKRLQPILVIGLIVSRSIICAVSDANWSKNGGMDRDYASRT